MDPTIGRQLSALAGQDQAQDQPHAQDQPQGQPVVLADRPDGTVVRVGDVVAKAHAPGTDAEALSVRLSIAASPLLGGALLCPLGHLPPRSLDDGRPASLWPLGRAVDPDNPDSAPWEAAGELLARLHTVPVSDLTGQLPGPLPPMRGPAKAARAMARMRTALRHGAAAPAHRAAAEAVERAWAGLPPGCGPDALRGSPGSPGAPGIPDAMPGATPDAMPGAEPPPWQCAAAALCHGDFHLGQLVRSPAPYGPWRLIDIDDLGLGDPAWDLARPAAWFAAGLLAPDAWSRFLAAYERTRGTAYGGDPWAVLDAPARALTVQTVALAVTKAHRAGRPFDEAEEACADACARIAALTPRHRAAEPAAPAPAPAPAPASAPAVPNSLAPEGRRLERCEAAGEPPAARRAIRPVNRSVGRGN